MERPIFGGCLCKKIRFKALIKPKWISVCHCRMCQRAYGNTSATFMAFDKGNFKFTKGSPKYYQSSDIARRGFCPDCGSPIIFNYQSLDAVFIGTLDNPQNWQPNGCHLGIESKIPWDIIHDNLPQYRTEDDPEFIEASRLAKQETTP